MDQGQHAVVMRTDTVLTIISVEKFHTTTQQWDERVAAYRRKLRQRFEQALPEEKPELRYHLENWHRSFVARLDKQLDQRRLSWNQRRLMKSFPKMKMIDSKYFDEFKKDLLNK